MENNKSWPRYYYLFLSAFGISNLGNWIYLIALNVYVLRLTDSPAAIAGLYIVGPTVRIFCNFFVGSLIDRLDKKMLVIYSDIARGIFVFCMPFVDSIFLIYTLIALTNFAGTFFGPSNTYLITKLIRGEHRLRFNSLNSTLSSGSFMIGPAIGGAILTFVSIPIAMWVNAATFFIGALLLVFIPPVQSSEQPKAALSPFQTLKEDYQTVFAFSKINKVLTKFIFIYTMALMIAHSLDSQEITFLYNVLHITDGLYGVTVGLTGIGAIIGGLCAVAYATKLEVGTYIKVGLTLTLLCYLVFYSSPSLIVAITSFILLGFFMAFSNSGYATYYQESIPPEMMGRYGSFINLIQSVVVVLLTLLLGVLAEVISVQVVTVIFAGIGLLISFGIWFISQVHFKVEPKTM